MICLMLVAMPPSSNGLCVNTVPAPPPGREWQPYVDPSRLLFGWATGSRRLQRLTCGSGLLYALHDLVVCDRAHRNAGQTPSIIDSLECHLEHDPLRLGIVLSGHAEQIGAFQLRWAREHRWQQDRGADVDV